MKFLNYLKLKNKYITKDVEDFIHLIRVNDTNKYDGYKQILSKDEFDLLNLIKVLILEALKKIYYHHYQKN